MGRREIEIVVLKVALTWVIVIIFLLLTWRVGHGAPAERGRASSTVYAQDLKAQPRSYRRYKYRYSYRRSRSRTAAVNSRVAPSVVEPASRDVPIGGANLLVSPVGTPAGQLLLTSDWPAFVLMPPYQKSTKSENVEDPFALWSGGEVMLEREGDEMPAPSKVSDFHFVALGAITAVLAAFLFFAVIGEQHERQPATPQWPFGPDA